MKQLKRILDKQNLSNWFTQSVKGDLSRYVVALTDNINPSNKTLTSQIKSFDMLDNINIWGWQNEGQTFIDISTSFSSKTRALQFAKQFKQKAIFDIKKMQEIFTTK